MGNQLFYKIFGLMKVLPCNKCGVYLYDKRFCEKCQKQIEEEYELIVQLAEKKAQEDKD